MNRKIIHIVHIVALQQKKTTSGPSYYIQDGLPPSLIPQWCLEAHYQILLLKDKILITNNITR